MANKFFKRWLGFLKVALVIHVSEMLGFGLGNLTQFTRVNNAKQMSTFSTVKARSIEQCGHACAEDSTCMAVNYHEESEDCQLSGTLVGNGNTQFGVSGWDVLFKTEAYTNNCTTLSCFVAVKTSMTWDAANDQCINVYNGHLAYIKTALIKELITTLLTNEGIQQDVWIGGNDNDAEGVFKWTDGTLLNNGFRNWSPRQPDNNGVENCLTVRLFDLSRWNDAACSVSYKSICEIPSTF